MKVDLESLAESLDRLAEKKSLGPVERGEIATAADAVWLFALERSAHA